MRKRGKQGTWLVTAQAKGWIVVGNRSSSSVKVR